MKVSGTVNNNTSKNTTTNNTNKTNTTSKSNTTNAINKTEEKKETTPVVSSTSATFNDISERAWAVPAIEKMASRNFIVGKEKVDLLQMKMYKSRFYYCSYKNVRC